MASEEDHEALVGELSAGQTEFKADSSNTAKCSATKTETDIESWAKKCAYRSKKTDTAEICLSSKWITDVDRIEVSEEKRKQMMKKARAISRAITKKAARLNQNLPVSEAEQSSTASDVLATEKESRSEFVRTAAEDDSNRQDSRKCGWRIPRVRNVQTLTDSTGGDGDQPSPVSKVSPPLSKDASSSFRWHRRHRHKTREFGGEIPRRPVTSHQILGAETETAAMGLLTSSQLLATTSAQTIMSNVTEEKPNKGPSVGTVAEVMTEVPAETKAADSLLSCHTSLQNAVRIPSREMIEKIQSSSKQRSAILLSSAVPACAEGGTAVGFEVPLQKNLDSSLNTTQTVSCPTTASTLPAVVNASIPSSSCILPGQSVAAKKRKMNISQYKSILPQRQKMLQQLVSKSQPAELHVYARYKDIMHDHDYISVRKRGPGYDKQPPIKNVLPARTVREVVTVEDKVSEVTETSPANSEAVHSDTRRDVNTNNDTVGNLSPCVITSRLQPATAYASAALKFKRDSESVSAVNTSKNSTSAVTVQSVKVDSMPAYFDVISLPNRQTKISVSAATLVTKKRPNPQSLMTADDSHSTPQSSEELSRNASPCAKDVSNDAESRVSVSPKRRRDSESMTDEKFCSSRSSSVSSAISVSSDEDSSRSRSTSRSRSSWESSYSSDSRSENFVIIIIL